MFSLAQKNVEGHFIGPKVAAEFREKLNFIIRQKCAQIFSVKG